MLVMFSFVLHLSITAFLVFFPSVFAAQDAGLDALAAVISRQKVMGQEIGNELDEQNGKVYFVCVSKQSQMGNVRRYKSNHTLVLLRNEGPPVICWLGIILKL